MSNMLRVMQELEDAPDDFLRKIIEEGDERYPPWAATLVANQRADMRERFTARDNAHQAEQPTISQREADRLGGGIPTVDPGMPIEDPQLQQGIAAPMGQARGGLIRGYQTGDLVDPPWRIEDPRGFEGEFEDYEAIQQAYKAADVERLETGPRRVYEEEYLPSVGRYGEIDPITRKRREALGYEDWLAENPQITRMDLGRLGGALAGSSRFEDLSEEEFKFYQDRPEDMNVMKAAAMWRKMGGAEEQAQAGGVDEFGRAIGPDGKPIANVGAEDDYEYDNRDELMRMFSRARAKFEETGDPIWQTEMESIAAGLENLRSGPTAMRRRAEMGLGEEGDPDDWVRALEERQQARREGMYDTGMRNIQTVQDSILNRTELDEAYNELRRKDADLAAYQGERKGIRGLAERDREREYAESRQELSGDTVGRYEDLLDWDRERIGNLQRGTDMLVSTDFDDDYLKDIHTALGKVSTESTDIEHTALDSIVDQLEQGKTWEKEDYDQVFTTGETAQDQIDRALADRQLFGTTRAGEEANRERETLERLLESRLGLAKEGMGQEGANYRARLAESGAQSRAEQAARVSLTNYAADPDKWPGIEILYDDIIGLFESDDPMVEILRDAKLEVGVGMAESLRAGQQGDLPVTGITRTEQAEAMIQALSASGVLSRIPPEMLAEIARLGGG